GHRFSGLGRYGANDVGQILDRIPDQISVAQFGFAIVSLRLVGVLVLLRPRTVLLDRVDTHLVKQGQNVLDLLRGGLLRWQNRVDLLGGYVAAFFRGRDHRSHCIVQKQRAVGRRLRVAPSRGAVVVLLRWRRGLACHALPLAALNAQRNVIPRAV